MTPQDLRDKKFGIVVKPANINDVLSHPLVRDTPNGAVIALLAMNGLLEELAQDMEKEQLSSNAEDES